MSRKGKPYAQLSRIPPFSSLRHCVTSLLPERRNVGGAEIPAFAGMTWVHALLAGYDVGTCGNDVGAYVIGWLRARLATT